MNKRRFAAFAATVLIFVGLLFGQGPIQKVRLWDTNLSHSLLLNWNEDRAAGYTLNWIGITADRTITLQGNPTLDDWFDQSVKTTFSPTFVTVKLSALTDGYFPYHVADATGLANSVIRTDGTLVGVGMLPTVAQLEVNTSQIITSTTAAPYLKLINLSDTERDPVIQWAVGATPVTKFTMGVDDDDADQFKISAGSALGTTDRIRIDSVGAVLIGAGTKSNADLTLEVFGTEYPVIRGHRTTALTNVPVAGIDFLGECTGNMADGFGGAFVMSIKDSMSAIYYAASVAGIRDGADSTGALQFNVYANDVRDEVGRFSSAGTFHVGVIAQATTMVGGMEMATGTAPTDSLANVILFYSNDFVAGNACPYFRTENGTIIGLNQSLLTTDSPTFVALNLSATSNQIVLQSADVTGTITATPASSNKVWTLQNVTGTIYQTAGTDVAVADGGTNKSSWTLYAIPYASGTTTIGERAIGTAGQVLAVNSGANGYEWIAPGGGGADHFVDLLDVPANYAGAGGKVVKVNAGATALEFVAGGAEVDSFNDLDDVPASYVGQEGLFVRVNATADGLEYAAGGGGGAPTDAKYIVQEVNAGLSAEQSLGALATGIVKNTTTGAVGVLSIATATDIPAVAVSTTTITATGATNWAKVAGARWCLVRIWAAGGSGGRGGSGDGAGGGGGGASIERIFDYADLSDPVSVTIGTGGAAQTSDDTAGNVGGNTTFGAYLTAYGGGGGGAVTTVYGGGGGGGMKSVGSVGSGSAGGTGGDPGGGSYTAVTGVGRHSSFGGGCGGGAGPISAGDSGWGGGGGGGGTATSGNGVGGVSVFGGGGGGAGSDTGTPSAGGTSVFGGAGGAGATGSDVATSGTQPSGGGGGSESGNSGAGGDGKAVIISF